MTDLRIRCPVSCATTSKFSHSHSRSCARPRVVGLGSRDDLKMPALTVPEEPLDPPAQVVLPDLEHATHRRERVGRREGTCADLDVIEVPATGLQWGPTRMSSRVGRPP